MLGFMDKVMDLAAKWIKYAYRKRWSTVPAALVTGGIGLIGLSKLQLLVFIIGSVGYSNDAADRVQAMDEAASASGWYLVLIGVCCWLIGLLYTQNNKQADQLPEGKEAESFVVVTFAFGILSQPCLFIIHAIAMRAEYPLLNACGDFLKIASLYLLIFLGNRFCTRMHPAWRTTPIGKLFSRNRNVLLPLYNISLATVVSIAFLFPFSDADILDHGKPTPSGVLTQTLIAFAFVAPFAIAATFRSEEPPTR